MDITIMTNIRTALDAAWVEAISAYQAGRVNSERTLQSALYHHLMRLLPHDIHTFCEPTVRVDGYGPLIPDLLISQGNQVLAAIELKFVPHHYALFEDDLVKLRVYGTTPDQFPIRLDPETGQYSNELFAVSPDCLLVFAVVSRSDAAAVDEDVLRQHMQDHRATFIPLCYRVKVREA